VNHSSAQIIPFPTRVRDVELTKRQLANHWRVSTRWLELMVRDEGLPSRGIFAGKRRFILSEVEDWRDRRAG
jgi:hypothetical protein